MVYPTDGRNHYSGILNEKKITDYLNENHKTLFGSNISFKQRGGTQTVDDIEVIKDGTKIASISVKNHSKNGGTFDYINTSKIESYLDDTETLNKNLLDIKNNKLSESETRNNVNNHLEKYIEKINIKKILDNIHSQSPEYLIINEEGKYIHIINHNEIFAPFYNPESTFYIKKTNRSKTSGQIWCKLNNLDFNTNLRVRLILNNGINAFIGTSKSNKTSIPTIKIQQDSVKKLLSRVTKLIL